MLTYLEVHLYLVIPPILFLLAVYWPLLGRRDGVKIAWLVLMATLYTTPWDNFIIAQSGWGYPPNSILGKIYHIPLEEHLFFILQPIFLVLLHSICTHSSLLPFPTHHLPTFTTTQTSREVNIDSKGKISEGEAHIERKRTVQTLPRRPLASLVWMGVFAIGAVLVNESHGLRLEWTPEPLRIGRHGFYLGWILVWISPVIGWLTWLGARVDGGAFTAWVVGSGWLCVVDTIAIRNGAWFISQETTLGWEVWRGLPLEECLFFCVVSYLLVLATSLIAHLHALLLLTPALTPCPPSNPIAHIALLARVALDPPEVDSSVLDGLRQAEETLRKGSKSFEVAKLAFGREMRIGLVAIYAWCRVTDNLIDDPIPSSSSGSTDDDIQHRAKLEILSTIRQHLHSSYDTASLSDRDTILDSISHLTPSDRSAFHLFSALIPRLVPIDPFLELCTGYESDMAFLPPTTALPSKLRDPHFNLESHLPIKTTSDLLRYGDDVAGSIASAICYLAWGVLTPPRHPVHRIRPVDELVHHAEVPSLLPSGPPSKVRYGEGQPSRVEIIAQSREMGRALQLVNIARDVSKDANFSRVYIPLSFFPSAADLLALLTPPTTSRVKYKRYTLPTLDIADTLREGSYAAIGGLPRTARGGTRAMVRSYFEIARQIRRNDGQVDERGVKVSKWKRAAAAAWGMWMG